MKAQNGIELANGQVVEISERSCEKYGLTDNMGTVISLLENQQALVLCADNEERSFHCKALSVTEDVPTQEGANAETDVRVFYSIEEVNAAQAAEMEAALGPIIDDFEPEEVEEEVKPVVETGVVAEAAERGTGTGRGTSYRAQVFGFAVTGVIRWMGKDNFTVADIKKALEAKLGAGAQLPQDATIKIQRNWGVNGKKDVPALTDDQAAELRTFKTTVPGTTETEVKETMAALAN